MAGAWHVKQQTRVLFFRKILVLVQQLRQQGAIILGKANLSEWVNWMDCCMLNGFCTLGGQTQNRYSPDDPSGSSSGSAVATAAPPYLPTCSPATCNLYLVCIP